MQLNLSVTPTFLACSFRQFDPGEYHITRRCADSVLLLMLSGVLRFSEDGQPVELRGGEWYIQRNGLFQDAPVASDSPYYFYVHFNGCYDTKPDAGGLPLTGTFSTDILPLFSRLERADALPVCGGLDRQIAFLEILRALAYAQRPVGRSADTALQMAAYLSEHCSQAVSIEHLSQRFSYSGNQIIRLFRRYLGMTPHRYLTNCRLRRAEQLLLSTCRTMAQIAADCGYEDTSVFIRAFRALHGVPPIRWRERELARGAARIDG